MTELSTTLVECLCTCLVYCYETNIQELKNLQLQIKRSGCNEIQWEKLPRKAWDGRQLPTSVKLQTSPVPHVAFSVRGQNDW